MIPVNTHDALLRIKSDSRNPRGAARANTATNKICIFLLNLLSRKIAARDNDTGI
jgi:hypothetical protein